MVVNYLNTFFRLYLFLLLWIFHTTLCFVCRKVKRQNRIKLICGIIAEEISHYEYLLQANEKIYALEQITLYP
jgi:hypothetical protein